MKKEKQKYQRPQMIGYGKLRDLAANGSGRDIENETGDIINNPCTTNPNKKPCK